MSALLGGVALAAGAGLLVMWFVDRIIRGGSWNEVCRWGR